MYSEEIIRLLLLRSMPMYFNALVVEMTSRCTARCAMCYQAAGPKGSDALGDVALAVDEVARIVREAAAIESLQPRFHLTGGEAFLDIDACISLFHVARDAGFLDLTTTTNGYWAKDPRRARSVCVRARGAGVTTVELSWDHWHLPYVSPDAVSNCIDACHETGIEVNLRLLSTRSHTFEEAISHLRPGSVERADRITCGPVFPTGRAAELDRGDLYTQGTLDDNCHTYLNLTVNARGDVFPCCAGIDQTNTYLFGNVRDRSIAAIADEMNQSPMLRTIVFGGISALVPIIERAGIPIGRDYNSICHMCWSIFSRPECVEAIQGHFRELSRQAVAMAIAELEGTPVAAAEPQEDEHAHRVYTGTAV